MTAMIAIAIIAALFGPLFIAGLLADTQVARDAGVVTRHGD